MIKKLVSFFFSQFGRNGKLIAVLGVVGMIMDIPAGEIWPKERIKALKEEIEAAGLTLKVIESVNIHDDIKIGLPTRDKYIENYKETIRNLAEFGIEVICYNFMPVFAWLKSARKPKHRIRRVIRVNRHFNPNFFTCRNDCF